MLVDRIIAVCCFSFLFITATDVAAKPAVSPGSQYEHARLGHHGDKPWDVGDVSCGK